MWLCVNSRGIPYPDIHRGKEIQKKVNNFNRYSSRSGTHGTPARTPATSSPHHQPHSVSLPPSTMEPRGPPVRYPRRLAVPDTPPIWRKRGFAPLNSASTLTAWLARVLPVAHGGCPPASIPPVSLQCNYCGALVGPSNRLFM